MNLSYLRWGLNSDLSLLRSHHIVGLLSWNYRRSCSSWTSAPRSSHDFEPFQPHAGWWLHLRGISLGGKVVEAARLGFWLKSLAFGGWPFRNTIFQLYIESTCHPVVVATRTVTLLVGNLHKLSFKPPLGGGMDLMDIKHSMALTRVKKTSPFFGISRFGTTCKNHFIKALNPYMFGKNLLFWAKPASLTKPSPCLGWRTIPAFLGQTVLAQVSLFWTLSKFGFWI